MQEDPPGVEPLEVGGRQQGIEDPSEEDRQGQGDAEGVQRLIGLVLSCVRPDVLDKSRVSLSNFRRCKK